MQHAGGRLRSLRGPGGPPEILRPAAWGAIPAHSRTTWPHARDHPSRAMWPRRRGPRGAVRQLQRRQRRSRAAEHTNQHAIFVGRRRSLIQEVIACGQLYRTRVVLCGSAHSCPYSCTFLHTSHILFCTHTPRDAELPRSPSTPALHCSGSVSRTACRLAIDAPIRVACCHSSPHRLPLPSPQPPDLSSPVPFAAHLPDARPPPPAASDLSRLHAHDSTSPSRGSGGQVVAGIGTV